jgi:hypothetical protein
MPRQPSQCFVGESIQGVEVLQTWSWIGVYVLRSLCAICCNMESNPLSHPTSSLPYPTFDNISHAVMDSVLKVLLLRENPYAYCTKETWSNRESGLRVLSQQSGHLGFSCSFRDISLFASFLGYQMEIMDLFDRVIDWFLRRSCGMLNYWSSGTICRKCWTLPTSK